MIDKARKMFGSVLPRKFDLEDTISRLYAEVSGIHGIDQLAAHDGWKRLQGHLIVRAQELGSFILEAAREPEKNATALIEAIAARDVFLAFVGIFDSECRTSKNRSKHLTKHLKLLEETRGLPRPSELETSPEVSSSER